MPLTPAQTQIARRHLSGVISANQRKVETAVRQYRGCENMTPAARYETEKLEEETEALQVILAELHLLAESSKGRR